ncbi:hypothetical protein GCM10007989_07580 [Devosia pacifica]|uniref:Uncharacterized protein n=1 Tax=Devosia pacifica TaxID=1335967 RepID=A0A918VQN2_9HYPH|nr:hypothetical protein GCM10007989_07580 [Devosia pacifica]
MTCITLPWPDKKLSPNARTHWAPKAAAAKAARTDAGWAVRAAVEKKPDWHSVSVSMLFCPPDGRRRDRDNLISSMQAATDGIADALGIDDSKFVCTYAIGPVVKGGEVRVCLSEHQLLRRHRCKPLNTPQPIRCVRNTGRGMTGSIPRVR